MTTGAVLLLCVGLFLEHVIKCRNQLVKLAWPLEGRTRIITIQTQPIESGWLSYCDQLGT